MTAHTYKLNNCNEQVHSITTQILKGSVATDIEGGGNCLLVHPERNSARIVKICSTFAKVTIIYSAGVFRVLLCTCKLLRESGCIGDEF